MGRWWVGWCRGGSASPVPCAIATVLRRAALDHARAEHRRGFPRCCTSASPAGPRELFTLAPGEPADHAPAPTSWPRSCTGAAAAPTGSRVWLTRAGPVELQDVDAAWLAAACPHAAEAGRRWRWSWSPARLVGPPQRGAAVLEAAAQR